MILKSLWWRFVRRIMAKKLKYRLDLIVEQT